MSKEILFSSEPLIQKLWYDIFFHIKYVSTFLPSNQNFEKWGSTVKNDRVDKTPIDPFTEK